MKFAYLDMKKRCVTASFFFNARGEYLEKSVIGMYRSLLHQLFTGYPELQTLLDNPEVLARNQDWLSLNGLKDLFSEAVCSLGRQHFVCFVDALDECDEQQIRDMIAYFEDFDRKMLGSGYFFQGLLF